MREARGRDGSEGSAGAYCCEVTSVGLGVGGIQGCRAEVDVRWRSRSRSRSLIPCICAVPRSRDSLVRILLGPSVILAPACWGAIVGDAGEARCAGIPRADARLLAMEDDSLDGRRGCPDSRGICWGSVEVDALAPDSVEIWAAAPGPALLWGFSCWKRRICASFL